ncbi:MAG: serpin family protein [Bacteroidetes bacterium]|nr:serpin family protein [Bacteroidota bacterium]
MKILFVCTAFLFSQAIPAQIPCSSPVMGKASNQFSFDLYRQLSEKNGALFFSPFSIHSILDLTAEGARTQTLADMQQALHTKGIDNCIRNDNRDNLLRFNRGDEAGDSIYTANSIWLQKGLNAEPAFSSTANNYYSAGLRETDFIANAEGSRASINKWVEQITRERIKELIPADLIKPTTRMVLVNALWYKAPWAFPFRIENTSPDKFYTHGDTVMAPFMKNTLPANYMEDELAQMVELPYKSGKRSMLALLPVAGKEKEFEQSLTAASVEQRIAALKKQKVQVRLPKFKMETQFDLSTVLQNMGMSRAFSNNADFSGISQTTSLKISNVVHKAFIEVNENGTEAAAATAVLMVLTTSAHIDPVPVKIFNANRPFVFMIRDNETGIILFMGKMNKP